MCCSMVCVCLCCLFACNCLGVLRVLHVMYGVLLYGLSLFLKHVFACAFC